MFFYKIQDKNMNKLIEIVLNMTVEKFYKSEFLGYFILPVKYFIHYRHIQKI